MAYTSLEEQELNEIKSWWNENYKSIIAAVVLGAAGVFGWRFWQDYQISHAQQMSAQYEQIIYTNQDDTARNAQIDSFVKENGKTAYAALALLDKAKTAVEKQDFSQAEMALKEALTQAPDSIFASLTAIRLAEVQLQQNQVEAALASLEQVKEAGWQSRKDLMIGQIQFAKGDKVEAKKRFDSVKEKGSALEVQQAQLWLNQL